MVQYKEFKKIDGYRYQLMSNINESKFTTDFLLKHYRDPQSRIDGRKVKSVRKVKTARGYAVYVR